MLRYQRVLSSRLKFHVPILTLLNNILFTGVKYPRTNSIRTCSASNTKLKDLPNSDHNVPNDKIKEVYVWGNTVPGYLRSANYLDPLRGIEERITDDEPIRLKFPEDVNISDVSCGHGFTVFAGTSPHVNAKLFGTGLNYDSQIGYHINQNGSLLNVISHPLPINLPCSDRTKIIQTDCGRTHTIIVTDKEGTFSLGNNAFGQCGYSIVTGETYMAKKTINNVQNVDNIKHVSCGQDHTIFLNDKGELYSCGWGADGQTGLGHYKSQGIPTQLKGDIKGEKIIQVAGSSDTVLAVSDKGDLFGWGNTEYRQLKLATDEEQLNVPRHLSLPNVGKIIHAAAGGTMCAVINIHGEVYVWGYGILGNEARVSHLVEPCILPPNFFSNSENDSEVKIVNISCGLSYFAAITNHGDLYMWGKNRNSRLCSRFIDNIYFPQRINLPAEVVKISCGVNHVAVLCKKFL